ncbi:hypothetical protein [Methylorubrum sp. B1-46]|uniref:hypothetical protein n=1 Tax=Methylorubrum sp. B1-46 TaxID=2897334 RepID=UPI001E5B4323|nr:hypothetical protein [Methylorubrum sp. B1-46]
MAGDSGFASAGLVPVALGGTALLPVGPGFNGALPPVGLAPVGLEAAGVAEPVDGFPGSADLPEAVDPAAPAEPAEGMALLPVGPDFNGASALASSGRPEAPVGPLPDSALLPVGPGLAGSEAVGPVLVGSGFAEAAVAEGSTGLPITLGSAGRDESLVESLADSLPCSEALPCSRDLP